MARLHHVVSLLPLLSLLFLGGTRDRSRVSREGPAGRLTLWAWERPEDLRFVSDDVGVAYLAGSIYLEQQPALHSRLQPLHVGEHTPVTAVIRIEIDQKTPLRFPAEYRNRVAELALQAAAAPRVSAVQIDFDATASLRDFYRDLLHDLRQRLPPSMPLSITALGSWCLGDDWIAGLPIDDAVPMLFRMGADRSYILRSLADGRDFKEPLCRQSVGISTDEPWPEGLLSRRVYVFNNRAWDRNSFEMVERKLKP